MSDAAATAVPAKAAKRKSSGKPKKQSSHPKYSKMVKDALIALKVRRKIFSYVIYQLEVGLPKYRRLPQIKFM